MVQASRRAFLAALVCLLPLVNAETALAYSAGSAEIVTFPGYQPGTIVIKTSERHLYLTLGGGHAIRYPIAVGKPGKEWAGETFVARKVVNPYFSPPAVVKHDIPQLPDLIPPGPHNPLGPRALVLATDQYAIHGTNRPETIGTKASYGCIRMYNEHILDLFDRVAVGSPVVVTR
jgi:lipoprotein-anchoring transpeptidase ErfK/SrfK